MRATRAPLLLLFWGTLLVLVDVGVNGFDLVPDVAGWAIILVALGRLRRLDDDVTYAARMRWAVGTAWLGLGLAAVDVVATPPRALAYVATAVAVAHPLAVTAALLRLATITGAANLVAAWQVTFATLVCAFALAAFVLLLVHASPGTGAVAVPGVIGAIAAALRYLYTISRAAREDG